MVKILRETLLLKLYYSFIDGSSHSLILSKRQTVLHYVALFIFHKIHFYLLVICSFIHKHLSKCEILISNVFKMQIYVDLNFNLLY